MPEIFDQNAPRPQGKVPVIMVVESEQAAMDWIKARHPQCNVTVDAPPFGPGKLVFVDGDYSYFIG